MKTLKRLEQMLDERDAKIRELHEKVDKFEDQSEREWKWCVHTDMDKSENGLPVPRLELRAKTFSGNWGNYYWEYNLIYRHLLKHVVKVPLGQTTVQGGRSEPPIHPLTKEVMGPFRDGVHMNVDSEQLNLPAYYIIECDPPFVQKIEHKPKQ